mgnify:CR=1 FL=1
MPARSVSGIEGVHRIEDTDGLASAFAAVRIAVAPIASGEGVRFEDDLGRDEDDVPQAGRSSSTEQAQFLAAEVDKSKTETDPEKRKALFQKIDANAEQP